MQEPNHNQKSDRALREEVVLKFWKERDIFKKSLEKDSPKGNYVFYDGPPFATGQIHYGHILGSTAKDVIGRYQTMQGFHVPRRWGWDCHGLPIENIVEKELGIAGHKEIESYGIEKFVEYARSKVLEFENDWESGVERIGRWVDFRGGYKTMDNTFIESVWWALSQLNKKELVYEGVRVLAYCPRCETPIANSEIAMDNSYKDITDISVYVKFELVDEPGTYVLVWTTTPWTLPGNFALAINSTLNYVKIKIADAFYILAKDRLSIIKEQYEIVEENVSLLGKSYKPLFNYFIDKEFLNKENAWKIYAGTHVTADTGTGIVHTSPTHGEEDMELARLENLPYMHHVLGDGTFAEVVRDFMGLPVKPRSDQKDGHQTTDIEIIKHLAHNSLLFAKEKIVHAYPHCMRCDTPIIYYALPSWFINIQKVKHSLMKDAKAMTWIPEHLKEGRFNNILEGAPDWTISRNRYWASPLPIWKSSEGGVLFVDSLQTLKEKGKKSGNTYTVIRHGEAEHNLTETWSCIPGVNDILTEKGKEQVKEVAQKLEGKVDIIITSPFVRGKDTAQIIAEEIGVNPEDIIVDPRIGEWNVGTSQNTRPMQEYFDIRAGASDRYRFKLDDGESYADVFTRSGAFLYEIEEKYKGKNILIVTHGGCARSLELVAHGFAYDTLFATTRDYRNFDNAEMREIKFTSLPHNSFFELDLHRPYIDAIILLHDGKEYRRIPEVIDCWFESGSMPFAQDHYPFERPKWQKENFPAGFVAEYIAQTRTWFYYSLVVSSILFGKAPFEHVVTTGTLRAEDGQKMSKSKKNYPDPWTFIDQYGVDALRIYLMSGPLMKGEDANFSEKAVADIANKLIGRLQNVFSFYELYRDSSIETKEGKLKGSHVLDAWIIARLHQLVEEVTKGTDAYDMTEATRPFDLFVDDLSTWYLRRSRDRIKDGDVEAKQTLYHVLKTFTQVLAPFAPFTAEEIWQALKTDNDEESVHLSKWPKRGHFDQKVLDDMDILRELCNTGNYKRKQSNIPTRQPLNSFSIKSNDGAFAHLIGQSEMLNLAKDELNVRNIIFGDETILDTTITIELKKEGYFREITRSIQDMRKNKGYEPDYVIERLSADTSDEGEKLIEQYQNDIKRKTNVSEIKFERNEGEEIQIGNDTFRFDS